MCFIKQYIDTMTKVGLSPIPLNYIFNSIILLFTRKTEPLNTKLNVKSLFSGTTTFSKD